MVRKFSSVLIVATCLHSPIGAMMPNSIDSGNKVPVLNIASSKPIVEKELIYTNWTQDYNRSIWNQNKFNKHIKRAQKEWDNLDPLILKSIMAQESGFSTRKRNRYGYTGIVQLGRREAKQMGLVVKKGCDQRKTPYYAIPAAAKLMKQKAMHLHQKGFAKYGTPKGDEYWKFVSAAYNAGEGTIVKAMSIAYGNKKPKEVKFSDLVKTTTGNPWDSALVKAMPKRWRKVSKYKEIKEYAQNVIARARQT